MLAVRGLMKFGSRKTGALGRRGNGGALAVDDVSFHIGTVECLGLVGKSGCGKITTAKISCARFTIAVLQTECAQARAWFSRSLALNRVVEDAWMVALCYHNLGSITRGLAISV